MKTKRAAGRASRPAKRPRAARRPWGRVAVIGVGLIGGSLALAMKRRRLAGEIVGVGRGARNLALARRRGLVDRTTSDAAAGVEGADLVVLAAPVGALPELAKTIAPALAAGAVVMDVGSVKGSVVRALEAALPPEARFVGAHPIAGGEDSGAGAASADLFEGSRCVLTPTPQTDPRALARVRSLWRAVGARLIEMDAGAHDRMLAAVSHLPHVVAYAVVNAVATVEPDSLPFAGNGFRDFTRIAASHPEMWRDIVLANRERIQSALDAMLVELESLREAIDRQDARRLAEAFTRACEQRRALDRPAPRKARRGAGTAGGAARKRKR